MNLRQQAKQPTTGGMTSREAAALYLSEGLTDDPGLASMMDEAKKRPELLIPKGYVGMVDYKAPALVIEDPDAIERKRLAKLIGFDIDVKISNTGRATLTDKELGYQARCMLSDDANIAGKQLSKAMLQLKTKHERFNHESVN